MNHWRAPCRYFPPLLHFIPPLPFSSSPSIIISRPLPPLYSPLPFSLLHYLNSFFFFPYLLRYSICSLLWLLYRFSISYLLLLYLVPLSVVPLSLLPLLNFNSRFLSLNPPFLLAPRCYSPKLRAASALPLLLPSIFTFTITSLLSLPLPPIS